MSKSKNEAKRKLWADESMINAVKSVQEGKGLREASRLYNVPVETLRRRVLGEVDVVCRPGPPTVLTSIEEERLAVYIADMAEMGFGLSREDFYVWRLKLLMIQGNSILLQMDWLDEHGSMVSSHVIQA